MAKSPVLTPIILFFVKNLEGADASTGTPISKTLKEPWPMLIDNKTGDCWFAVDAKVKGIIQNQSKAQLKLWSKGSYYGQLS